ncbi:MAG: 50S ribosomal protein L10 [Gemmatimonadota bacterium]
MDRAKKHAFVDDLSGKLAGASFVYVTDFSGLDVERLTPLRARLRAASVEYVVVKNTLARRAIEGTAAAELAALLEGPSAFAISAGDAVAGAKVLTDFAKDGDRPRIKGGVVAGRILDLGEIRRLATLPGRAVLLGTLLGTMRAPVSNFVYVLSGVLSKFVRTVDAVRAQKEAGALPAAAEAQESPAAADAAPEPVPES